MIALRLCEETAKLHVGATTTAETRDRQGMVGPVVCRSQRDKILQHIQGMAFSTIFLELN